MDYKDVINIPSNAILPFDPRRYKLAIGSAEYVAIEVIVSKLIRMLLKRNNKGWLELATVHAISLSYMGGAAGFADPPGALANDFTNQLIDGAKGIPALFLAQYTIDTGSRGFHIPFQKWGMTDVMISAASKALSRPLFGLLYPLVKGTVGAPLDLVNEMVGHQTRASFLKQFTAQTRRTHGI